MKVTRLDELKAELAVIEKFPCLSYDCKEKCREWYKHEIDCIETWGSPNPEMEINPIGSN